MFIPWLGGFIWTILGYEYVFIARTAIALLNLLSTSIISFISAAA
ncbi:MAG TPA: hypothetical protein VN456_03865 [Desulfosporosinus sp.]|nr:hypothetical protein [Desulfosporosinus sp.]